MLHIWSCPKTALYATASNAVLAPCADWAGLELASLICCQLVHPILNLSGQKTWNVCVLCWNRRPASFGFLETMTYISVTKGKTFKAFKVSSDETKSPLSTLELLPNVLVPSTQDWFSDEVHLAAGLELQILYQKGKTYQTPTRMTSSWILARWSDQWLGSPDYNSSIRHTYYIFWFSQLKSRWDHQMIQALILTSNGGGSHKSVCNIRLVCRQKLAQNPAVSLSSSESEQLSSSACLEWDALHSANCHSPAELSPEKLVHPFDEGNIIQNEMACLCATIMPSEDIERVSTIYHPHCPTWAYTIIHPHVVMGRSHKTACKIRLVWGPCAVAVIIKGLEWDALRGNIWGFLS